MYSPLEYFNVFTAWKAVGKGGWKALRKGRGCVPQK
jgi:hypothetical protein